MSAHPAAVALSHLVDVDALLTTIAKQVNPRVKHWWGVRSTSSVRAYVCHLCGCVVDTDSAKYPKTKHALRALDAHKLGHL